MPRILLSLTAVLALSACDEPGLAPDLPVIGAEATAATSANFDYQIIEDRYIVIQAPVGCVHSTGGWTRSRLFPGATAQRLMEFCVYTWGSGGTPDLSLLPSGSAATVSPDRYAISGMGTNELLEDATIDQIDPIASYATTLPAIKTRLAILDTLPTSDTPNAEKPFDEHGLKLAALADEAVCDDPVGSSRRCAADVVSTLAIAWEQTGTVGSLAFQQPVNSSLDLIGGSVGRQSDIATALVATVDDWEADRVPPSSTVGNVVINLSLGWHKSGDGSASRSASEEAVYAALAYASCRDALVVAAAGHLDTPVGGDGASGASYPAAWEAYAQPTDAQCLALYDGTSRPVSTSAYKPLLYAVGAVTTDRQPLPITRPGSMPKVVAPGSFLNAGSNLGSGRLNDPITGTSAATIVVASAAAVMRTHRSGRSNHDIMKWLHSSGFSTGATSQVRLAGTAPKPIKVANVCRGLAQACAGSACAASYPLSACDGSAVLTVNTLPASPVSDDELSGTEWSGTCATGHSYYYYAASGHLKTNYLWGANCPIQQEDSGATIAVVQPMPPNTFCPHCPTRFDVGGEGWADLHTTEPMFGPSAMGGLGEVTLTIHFATEGGEPDHYPLNNLVPFSPTHILVELPLDSGERSAGGTTHYATGATLDYILDGFAYSEPLYLEQ